MGRFFSGSSILCAMAFFASQSAAGDFVVGLGLIGFDDELASLEIEFHSEPWNRVFGFDVSFAGVAVLDDAGDIFAGFGLSGFHRFENGWRLEASFVPGVYESNLDFTDLGNTLNFRSLIAVGREIAPGRSLSIAASHVSNADLGDTNPGVNTLSVRWRQSF